MVRWKPDGDCDVLKHPDIGGHHHVLLLGNWKRELLDFCHLFKITARGAVRCAGCEHDSQGNRIREVCLRRSNLLH